LQFLVESLSSLNDLSTVDAEVLDAVVSLAGSGRMATDTLLRFGDRAVVPLIRGARRRTGRAYPAFSELNVLYEMLARGDVARTLTNESSLALRDLARDVMSERDLDRFVLASAGALAVATGRSGSPRARSETDRAGGAHTARHPVRGPRVRGRADSEGADRVSGPAGAAARRAARTSLKGVRMSNLALTQVPTMTSTRCRNDAAGAGETRRPRP